MSAYLNISWLSSLSNLEADFHDTNTENLVHDHKSKESKLKSQNEGWNFVNLQLICAHPLILKQKELTASGRGSRSHARRHSLQEVVHPIRCIINLCSSLQFSEFIIRDSNLCLSFDLKQKELNASRRGSRSHARRSFAGNLNFFV